MKKKLKKSGRRKRLNKLYFQQHGICYYCGEYVNRQNATIEHIIPKIYGGYWTKDNLVMACFKCNCVVYNHTNMNKELLFIRAYRKRLMDSYYDLAIQFDSKVKIFLLRIKSSGRSLFF